MGVRGLIGAWAIAELCFMTNGMLGRSPEGVAPQNTPTNCHSFGDLVSETRRR